MMAKRQTVLVLLSGVLMCCQKAPDAASVSARDDAAAGRAATSESVHNGTVRVDSSAGKADRAWLSFEVAGDTMVVLKVADRNACPMDGNLGVKEFRRARQVQPGQDWVLLHIVAPITSKDVKFRHVVPGSSQEIPAASLIQRMPNSPVHTYVVVSVGEPGRIEATSSTGVVGVLDLDARRAELSALEPVAGNDTRFVSYQNLPRSIDRPVAGR